MTNDRVMLEWGGRKFTGLTSTPGAHGQAQSSAGFRKPHSSKTQHTGIESGKLYDRFDNKLVVGVVTNALYWHCS